MFPTLPRFVWAALLTLLLVASLAGAGTGQAPSAAAPTPKDWEATLARAEAYVRAARPDSVSHVELSAALELAVRRGDGGGAARCLAAAPDRVAPLRTGSCAAGAELCPPAARRARHGVCRRNAADPLSRRALLLGVARRAVRGAGHRQPA